MKLMNLQSWKAWLSGLLVLCFFNIGPSATITNLTPLDDPSAGVIAMNSRGQAVGFFQPVDAPAQHGFLSSGGVLYDLGTLGGSFSTASGINSNAQIIGFGQTAGDGDFHAFLISGGTKLDLGTFGGTGSFPAAINNSGQVAGAAQPTGNPGYHAFLCTSGTMLNLGTLGGLSSFSTALNNAGQVVGYSTLAGDTAFRAFLVGGGIMQNLGSLGGDSFAFSVNDAGQIVGESVIASGDTHAFIFANGAMSDLGTLGGVYSSAFVINNSGQIMGDSTTTNEEHHAFIFQNGVMSDLGTLGGALSFSAAINSHGQVVGSSEDAQQMVFAFLWDKGVMVDLNTLLPANSGWMLLSASLINDAGQIGGYGTYNGTPTWYLLSVNRPPVANAGPDQTVNCPSPVVLDGSKSSDPDGDSLTFVWREGATVLGQAPVLSGQLALGQHTITLTVTDPGGLSSQAAIIVQVVDTVPPSVACPLPMTAPAAANCQTAVPDFTGNLSASDTCTPADHLLVGQNPPAGTLVGIGVHTITMTVTDASGNVGSCATTFTVLDKTPPVINCPAPVKLSANGSCQALVPDFLANLSTSDNCTSAGQLVKSQNPAAGTALGLGTYSVVLTVSDASGNTSQCSVSVQVVDTTAPVISSVTANPDTISQVNRKMVPVTLSVSASDNCSASVVSTITSITSTDPVTGQADSTSPDWEITGALTANVRAETVDHNNSRVYTLTVRCTDAAGNSSTKTVTVTVLKPGH